MECGGLKGGGVRAARPTEQGWKLCVLRQCRAYRQNGRGRTPPLRIFERFYNGRTGASAPTDNKKCCESGRRGNRRSAASGGRSELISRKCPDWRPQQWPGIGWHDGGQPPPPTDGYMGYGTAGDRKGRPCGCVTRGAVGRADAHIGPYAPFSDRIS